MVVPKSRQIKVVCMLDFELTEHRHLPYISTMVIIITQSNEKISFLEFVANLVIIGSFTYDTGHVEGIFTSKH